MTTGDGIFCSGAHIARKAGAGLSSSVSGAMVTDFIAQAESFINATTRYNWSDVYTSLNTDTRAILTECASNLAAMYAINYDMGGYNSRAEAETMLDVLRDGAERCINILKEKKAEDFIA